ncbi:MAG: hydroxyectoine utilization dehydratase EutB [Anaerolineales bacterium]|jgi:threonine dehydratase
MTKAKNITLQDIYLAQQTITPLVIKTPLVKAPALSKQIGASVYFKLEILQKTGSFKARGAANKIFNLTPDEKAHGVVTASTGNHGRAVSYAAHEIGIPAVVCMSADVPKNKVQAIEALGAEVVIHGKSQDDAFVQAETLQVERGLKMIPPFDDPDIIAGQGTIGIEILEQLPSAGSVLVPLSGGGLISGIALAMKSANPNIRVIGVSMERAPVMYHSLKAGKPIQMDEDDTLADSLRGGIGTENQYTFEMVRNLVDEVVLVSEDEIASAMRFAFKEHRLVLEGAGAIGIAALLAGKIQNIQGEVVSVLSGGNVDMDAFMEIVRD